MKAIQSTFDLLVQVEGLKLIAYQCPKKVWTIGIGNTYYPNGEKVKKGDTITKDKAVELFYMITKEKELSISRLLKVNLNQKQYDVVFSICWQYGASWLSKSKILTQVNKDPNNLIAIKNIFGLMEYKSRREVEFKHYTS